MHWTLGPAHSIISRLRRSATAQKAFRKYTKQGFPGSTPQTLTVVQHHIPRTAAGCKPLRHRTRPRATTHVADNYESNIIECPPGRDEVLNQVDKLDPFPSALATPRRIDIMLPPSYNTSPSQRYPVLYMHDGQNCIDPKSCFTTSDWGVDECMDRLLKAGKTSEFISVLIWNTPQRSREYMPAEALNWLMQQEQCWYERVEEQYVNPTSDAYLAMLVEELKPYVDQHYRTLPNRDDTMLMGSSMGGLISLYALQKYPEVFGAAACLSTHWLPGKGVTVGWLAAGNVPDPNTHRLYFDHGTKHLDARYGPYQKQVDAILEAAGYTKGKNYTSLVFDGEKHNEAAWRRRLHIPMEFLFGKSAAQQQKEPEQQLQ